MPFSSRADPQRHWIPDIATRFRDDEQKQSIRILKAGWTVASVSQIADHCLGKMLDKQKNRGELRPYLRNLNVRWFGFDLSDILKMRFEEGEADRYQARKGDLVVCEGGYPGRAAIWESDDPIYLQKALHRVRFHEPERAKWVLYWLYLRDMDGTLPDSFNGAGIQHFTKAALAHFEVPLPPLAEQKRIVAMLDQAFVALDRARANAEANLADAAELFTSELRERFKKTSVGNERLSFDQLCDTLTPKIKIKRKDYLDEGEYPIVSQEAETVSGYWNDPDALLRIERPIVVFGDHTRCLKYIDFDFVVGADGTKIMQPKPGISAGYLYFGLRSRPVPEGGYARHFKFVRERTLPDISFREQEDLARALFDMEENCAELEAAYRAKLADITALRQSLLQKAFAGDLT